MRIRADEQHKNTKNALKRLAALPKLHNDYDSVFNHEYETMTLDLDVDIVDQCYQQLLVSIIRERNKLRLSSPSILRSFDAAWNLDSHGLFRSEESVLSLKQALRDTNRAARAANHQLLQMNDRDAGAEVLYHFVCDLIYLVEEVRQRTYFGRRSTLISGRSGPSRCGWSTGLGWPYWR